MTAALSETKHPFTFHLRSIQKLRDTRLNQQKDLTPQHSHLNCVEFRTKRTNHIVMVHQQQSEYTIAKLRQPVKGIAENDEQQIVQFPLLVINQYL
jgi:hypothetical protein